MKDLFIPYELALKLKEKGFDEPCFALYSLGLEKDNYKQLQFHLDYGQAYGDRGIFIPISDNFFAICKRNSDHPHVPSAPLYQQVIDWFYKNHMIQITCSNGLNSSSRTTVKPPKIDKLTYLTLDEAIEEALKLIP